MVNIDPGWDYVIHSINSVGLRIVHRLYLYLEILKFNVLSFHDTFFCLKCNTTISNCINQ